MNNQNPDTNNANIIESMNEAFNNGSFYGLEYVLDEWVVKTPTPVNQHQIDWFGFWDLRG